MFVCLFVNYLRVYYSLEAPPECRQENKDKELEGVGSAVCERSAAVWATVPVEADVCGSPRQFLSSFSAGLWLL